MAGVVSGFPFCSRKPRCCLFQTDSEAAPLVETLDPSNRRMLGRRPLRDESPQDDACFLTAPGACASAEPELVDSPEAALDSVVRGPTVHKVHIQKRSNEPLGLTLRFNGSRVIIVDVHGGAALRWNDANPKSRCSKFDAIIGVGELFIGDEMEDMETKLKFFEAIRQPQDLFLTLLRPAVTDFRIEKKGQPLGLVLGRVETFSYGLIISEIKAAGAVPNFAAENPGSWVPPAKSIIRAACGIIAEVPEHCEEMLAAIKRADHLNMTVMHWD